MYNLSTVNKSMNTLNFTQTKQGQFKKGMHVHTPLKIRVVHKSLSLQSLSLTGVRVHLVSRGKSQEDGVSVEGPAASKLVVGAVQVVQQSQYSETLVEPGAETVVQKMEEKKTLFMIGSRSLAVGP